MTQTMRKGPRTLSRWMSGEVPQGKWDVMAAMSPSLASTICLCINKQAKTAAQIAEEVDANKAYVEDVLGRLTELEVFVTPQKDRYRLNYIAFDAEDWRKIVSLLRQPAAEIAKRLAAAQETLQTTFERTPLARSGWSWNDMTWVINCLVISNKYIHKFVEGRSFTLPVRPGGYKYWLGGYEWDVGNDLDSPGFYGTDRGSWGFGHFGPTAEHKNTGWIFEGPAYGLNLAHEFLNGPISKENLLSRFSESDRDAYRSTLAKFVAEGLVERKGDNLYQFAFPVFQEADNAILEPVVAEVVKPLAEEIINPLLQDIGDLFDGLGYSHLRDQYAFWSADLTGFTMGEALRFMIKQGILPELGDSPPVKWCYTAWKGKVKILSPFSG